MSLFLFFSKAYGLAGARIGYALASPEMVTLIDTVNEPFNANRVAIAGAIAAIKKDQAGVTEAVASIQDTRQKTASALSRMGLRQFQSQANFIMFETPYPAETIFERMLDQGVVVRPCGPWGLDRMIRVTIGTSAQMAHFLSALENVMGELGR